MARLEPPQLAGQDLALYRATVAPGERAARELGDAMPDSCGLDNVVGILFHSPPLARAVIELVSRFQLLPQELHELVVLRVAVRERSAYEWLTHRGKAGRAGLSQATLEGLLSEGLPQDPAQAEVVCAVDDVLAGRPLPAALAARLGAPAAVELVALCGVYQLFAHLVSAFELPLPPGTEDPFAG